jgi:hypothetical protein
MAVEASTAGTARAKPAESASGSRMGRIVLIIVGLGVAALGAGFVYLGVFPPEPTTRDVQRTLPNDRFQPR